MKTPSSKPVISSNTLGSVRDNIIHKIASEEIPIMVHAYRPESKGSPLGPPPKAAYTIRRQEASTRSEIVREVEPLILALNDQDGRLRAKAASILGELRDSRAVEPLIRSLKDSDSEVRQQAILALGKIGDVQAAGALLEALKDDSQLVRNCADSSVRWGAADALGSAFSQVPSKDQAWQDLHKLTQDEDHSVRGAAARVLGSAFSQVPDKDQAWQDLIRLTQDEDSSVRWGAADALGSAFSQVPSKDQAWQDLHKLTQDEDHSVRGAAAGVLGSAFSQVPDKDQAWQDLHSLTQDENSNVRMYAYHSLGRASVLKVTEADDNLTLRRELENAVAYFEKSTQEASFSNPSKFCYPFYRTYLAITFQEAEEDEVQKYLEEARKAVGGSESKDKLFKSVQNLASALQESRRLKYRPIQDAVSELNAYCEFCYKTAEHMAAAEDRAPVAVKLMKKCNPLIEDRMQATIAEIREKAKHVCQATSGKGSDYETLGVDINRAASSLSIEDITKTQRCVSRIALQLKEFCRLLPPGKKELVCDAIKEIFLADEFSNKLEKIELALTYVSSAIEAPLQAKSFSKYLDESQVNSVEAAVQRVLEKKGIDDLQLKQIIERLESTISEIEEKQIDNPSLKGDVEEVSRYLEEYNLDLEQKLKVTIPLIPILLAYQEVNELKSAANLRIAWNKLTRSSLPG
ncbi:MAG: HEAT repeat domain-containing protein [Methanothrix sp.]|nr:HEAT repeat domain-containing protein [Methanothrix sp.]